MPKTYRPYGGDPSSADKVLRSARPKWDSSLISNSNMAKPPFILVDEHIACPPLDALNSAIVILGEIDAKRHSEVVQRN
jgi:hypothetical protein